MPTLKAEVVRRFAAQMLPETEIEDFTTALLAGDTSRPALLYTSRAPLTMAGGPAPAALPEWVRVVGDERFGRSAEHERGEFYCADLSSVILGLPATTLLPVKSRVVDVCAAPGGKSVMAWRALAPEQLVANEVDRRRVKSLIANFKRCSIKPADVTNVEVDHLAALIPESGDLVIVDAPCSAQSFGAEADSPFFKTVVNTSVKRQRRILANAAKIVRGGGFLQYSTCTFSVKENEGVIKWFLKNNPEFTAVSISGYEDLLSPYATTPSYRVWPHRGGMNFDKLGRGGFVAVLQRQKSPAEKESKPLDIKGIWQGN